METQLRDLIEKCSEGNREAQYKLYKMYSPLLYGVALRYSYNQTTAEDILQDSFVKIFANIQEFRFAGSFEGWLKKVVINTAITGFYKDRKHHHHADLTDYEDTLPDENAEFDSAEFTREELQNVIDSLPEGYKMIFNLYAIEGFKHREIAEMLGIDINTSKSQFMRARESIIRKLTELKQFKKSVL